MNKYNAHDCNTNHHYNKRTDNATEILINLSQNNNKINIFSKLPCDVLLYSICDSFLYPHEIYRLLILSKNTNKMLISNNGALFKKLKSKQNITKYILHGIDILNEIVIGVKDDVSGDSDGDDDFSEYVRFVRLGDERRLGYYLLRTFKSILYVHDNNHNDINHNDDIKTNINISTENNQLTIHDKCHWLNTICSSEPRGLEMEKLVTLKHLLFFFICSWKHNHFFNDKDFAYKRTPHPFIISSDSNCQPILNFNRLKHMSKYCIKNYNVNQQNKMRNRGVLLSNVEKMQFTKENIVLVFNKFDKLSQYNCNQRKIFWDGWEPCQTCENRHPIVWHRLFIRYINRSNDYIGLSLNKVFKRYDDINITFEREIICRQADNIFSDNFRRWIKSMLRQPHWSYDDYDSCKCHPLEFVLTNVNVEN